MEEQGKRKDQELGKEQVRDVAGGKETYVIWECDDCAYRWESMEWDKKCPECQSEKIHTVGTHVHW